MAMVAVRRQLVKMAEKLLKKTLRHVCHQQKRLKFLTKRYRAFYILNWIYRYFTEGAVNYVSDASCAVGRFVEGSFEVMVPCQ